MSTINVNNIESSTGGGVAAKLASVNGGFIGTKNLIINGSCIVAQRGTSSTTSGYQTVDRFKMNYGGTDEAPTQAQVDVASGTTPYSLGFRKAFRVTNGNQTSGAGTNDNVYIQTKLESQDLANSGWNYTSASSFITLSFWVKSSVAQNFYGYLRTMDGTGQRYAFETGSLSADTWTKVTKTISGNSNLQFDNDANEGLQIIIAPFWGTAFTDSGVSLNAWGAYSGSARMPDNTSTWYTTNDATFEITGVQLEVGSVATDFEHRSFAEELNLCKRYFQVHNENGKFTGNTSYYRSGSIETQFKFEPEMRATPSFSHTSDSNYYYFYRSNGNDQFNSWGSTNAMGQKGGAVNASTSSASNGIAGAMYVASGGKLEFSAEL